VPAIYQIRAFAAAGGLMSYGATVFRMHTVRPAYAPGILKGETPSDLPVQQASI
jgi:putative ABC transport system substrate-binding protein